MKLKTLLKELNYNSILENNNTLIINYPIETKIRSDKFYLNEIYINDFIIQLKSLLESPFYISYHKRNINMETSLITHCKRMVNINNNYQYLDKGENPFLFSSPSLNYENTNYNMDNAKSVYYVKYYEQFGDYYIDEQNNTRFDFVNKDIKNTKNFIEKELKETYIEYSFPINNLLFHPLDNCITLQQTFNLNNSSQNIMETLYGLSSDVNHNFNLQFRINIDETKKISQHKQDTILQIHEKVLKVLNFSKLEIETN